MQPCEHPQQKRKIPNSLTWPIQALTCRFRACFAFPAQRFTGNKRLSVLPFDRTPSWEDPDKGPLSPPLHGYHTEQTES